MFCNLHIQWMCTCITPYHITPSIVGHKPLEVYLKFWVWYYLPRDNQEDSVMVEATDPSKMAPTSMLNIQMVFHNLHIIWIWAWMIPYNATASLTKQALW